MKLIDRRMEYYNKRNLYYANIKDKPRWEWMNLKARELLGEKIIAMLKERKPH